MANETNVMSNNQVHEDENGGRGYLEFGSIGGAIVQVFHADEDDRGNDNGK